MAFLPLVSAKSGRSGRQPRKRRAVSTEPVRMTPPTRESVTSARPTSSSGQGTNCKTSRGTPAAQRACASPQPTSTASGAGLRTTALPAASAASTPPAGMESGKFHGGVTDDHAERLHAAVAQLGRGLPQRARVVAREVHRLGDLGVRLRGRLRAVHDHGADEIAAPAGQLARAGLQERAARLDAAGGPAGLGAARHREGTLHLGGAGQRVAVGDAARARGIVAFGRPRSRDEVAPDLERDLLRPALAPAAHDVRDPGAIGGQRPVRVGLVLEGRVERQGFRRLGATVLGAPGRVGDGGPQLEGGEEAIPLGFPVRGAGLEVEHVAQEVLGRGVLVQPAHEIRDGAVEILRAHHRGVEEEAARARLHRAGLMVGHALQHLELDPRPHVMGLAQHEAVGHVEEVVAGHAQVHGLRVLGPAAVLEHALVVGVDLGLVLVGRLRPAVRCGLDSLHGEVGALHDAQLDGARRRGPAAPPPSRSARVARGTNRADRPGARCPR